MSEQQQSELAEAIKTVASNPSDDALWERIEELAGELDDPESVAKAYRGCLEEKRSAGEAVALGKRAARFHEEWFGDDRAGLAKLLSRVLELDPKSEWAFQELTVVLTVAERWDDVIKLYQTVIDRTNNKTKLVKLLDEAYQVAKDLANRPDQAIDFLKAKLEIKPSVKQRAALERLLERYERWSDLIALWQDDLGDKSDEERVDALTQIAQTYFEKLGDARNALEALQELFVINQAHPAALTLLEKIALTETISSDLRSSALAVVRQTYEATQRSADIVRVLGDVLPLCDDTQRKGLHAELGERLSELDEHAASLDHYAALLMLDPSSSATQRALRREAQLTDRFDRYASALASAADSSKDPSRRVSLLSDAALTTLELVENEAAAIDLLQAALATEGIKPGDILNVGKRLNLLLERAGRPQERLTVLERLADAETVESSQRALIGDVASLAEELGEVDRALAAWRRRIQANASDLRALEALVGLLNREERWQELIDALTARSELAVPDNQKRSDLIRIATIYETELEESELSLQAWVRVKEQYGDDPEVIAALSRLMTSLGRWAELTSLLEGSNAKQVAYLADQFANLGRAYQQSLGDNVRAIECYRQALTVDVAHAGAREGLTLLLDNDETRNIVAEALVHSLRSSGDLIGLLDLVDARMAGTDDARKHAEILREAADIAEEQAGDSVRVIPFVAKLFPMTPRDRVLEDRMIRLARHAAQAKSDQTESVWQACLAAYSGAEAALADDPYARSQMQFREAMIREKDLDDPEGALRLSLDVIAVQPNLHDAVAAVMRLAAPLGRYDDMSATLLRYAEVRDGPSEEFLTTITEAAASAEGWPSLCKAMQAALSESPLGDKHKAELQWQLANWYEHELADADAAQAALLVSVKLDPNRVDTHKRLVELQSDKRDEALYTTLLRLCEIDASNLDHFVNAAELALEALSTQQQQTSLTALQGRAVGAWRGSEPASSERAPEEIVVWTIEELVKLYTSSDQAQRALDLLIDASRLPFDSTTCLAMRNRAATIASDVLKDNDSAIDMYRAVLAQAPSDANALQALGALYEKQGRLPELLGLKRNSLTYVEDEDRRLELRLEISALIDEIDRSGGRLELLQGNLEAVPGHRSSLQALTSLLAGIGKHQKLNEILSQQAQTLECHTEMPRAAEIWNQVARVAEEDLQDVDQALLAYRKVVNLAPNLPALDALARLYIDRSQSGAAVPWLEQALDLADESERPQLLKRLAEAHLAADHRSEAIACLTNATQDPEQPRVELRLMLADLLRDSSKWRRLADTLTSALPHMSDPTIIVETAREAADIYHRRLRTPEAAVPALARALELVADDRSLRLMMARSQRVAGQLATAREILESLIADFGRRRSKERAAVHVELAQVARAEAKLDDAMSELDLASKMDVGNAHILRALAELARDQGDLDQAERSLRALLLIVRRQPPGDDEQAVGISEVLFELHHIAAVRDDEENSAELLESVIEAASASDAEVRRLRRTLLEHQEHEFLAKVLRSRIALSEDVESKTELLAYVADLLEGPLEDPKGALQARLECLELQPDNQELHNTARVLAGQLGKTITYLEALEEMIAQQRRAEEKEVTGSLLMRAGHIAENDLDDLDRARAHYTAAEECMSAPADALFALARVCATQGDAEEQTRALDELTNLAVADGPEVAQADALYRLAELQVVQPELVERGIELLNKALAVEPRFRQAALTLKVAAETAGNSAAVLAHYESAARQSGDKLLLLDFLERRAAGDATLDQIREAVDLAGELEENERAIRLLERAIEGARKSADGLSEAVWAASDLARHYGTVGKLEQAKELLFEIAYLASQDEVTELGLFLADKSKAAEEYGLAVEFLEFLRQRDPNVRAIWSPLLALYRELGNGEALSNLVDATLPSLIDPAERTQLRLEKAQYLVDASRDEDAIELLRDACLDAPDSIEAAALLETVLRKEGNEEALSDFLWQRFNDAKDRGNAQTISDVACRLGGLLDQIGQESMPVFLQALEVVPESPELLRAVLSRAGDEVDATERAELSERLLEVEDVDNAADLTLSLVRMREDLGDTEGVQRALEIGQRICPEHTGLRDRLEAWYHQSEQWAQLAQMKIAQAETNPDPTRQVQLLREAAALYRDKLSDMDASSSVLAQAQILVPSDEGLASELASVHASAGRFEEGIQVLGISLEKLSGAPTLPLLLLRSHLLRNLKRDSEAIADLEVALNLDPKEVQPMLVQALEIARITAQERTDVDSERATTMRLIELFDADGNEESARDMLLVWIERDSQDVAALTRLRDMDISAERWDGVVLACTHLVALASDEDQALNAIWLADAANHIGATEHARAGLERAHQDQPGNAEIRQRLHAIYQTLGAHRELADLLLIDASFSEDEDERYDKYRSAASIYVNDLNDASAAIEPAQRAKELRPEDHNTVVLLADVLVASGKLPEAVAMLEPAIANHKRRSPELASLQYRMAKVSAAQDDREEQLEWLKKAFDVDRKDGLIASELAHLATELGDYDLALKPLRAITLMDNPAPVSRVMALLWEAKIEHARGNRAKAELWAKKALREDPEYSEAEDFLAQIAE